MSSVTSEFLKEMNNVHINPRNALSTVKRTRQYPRRKILQIAPLRLDEIKKQIEEASADTNHTWDPPTVAIGDKENKPLPAVEDSFELNFAALSLNTPAKLPEVAESDKFQTPCPATSQVLKTNRSLDFCQYKTPNNTIPPKVQCSVNMKQMRTPLNKPYAISNQNRNDCDTQNGHPPVPKPIDFPKIHVNKVVYLVLNELGRGGSSEVFHCFNPEAKTHRAIKVVSLENKNSAAGFINEVQVLKRLQKCNRIIKMFDFEIKKEEKTLLVVLEIGGIDLSKILKDSGLNSSHMPFYMLQYYWMEMLYAVKQIHTNGIVHSDLKPANFLQVGGCLKLIDFGIASCIQSDMTSVFKAVPEGSFNYISPEALSNESSSNVNSPTHGKPKYKISYKCDVWSLGCILYQLIYGRTPFQHITNMWKKMAAIVDPDYKIEYPAADWVPREAIETIKQCLQVNVKLRPSVDELISVFEH